MKTTRNDLNDDDVIARSKIIKQKVEGYKKLNLKVHINYANSKKWRNGMIREISDDFFIINDDVDGLIPIFFIEVAEIDKFLTHVGKGAYQ